MNKEDVKRIDEFNVKLHKRVNEVISEILKEYEFVKNVKCKFIIDM